jgi:hypothetical protein
MVDKRMRKGKNSEVRLHGEKVGDTKLKKERRHDFPKIGHRVSGLSLAWPESSEDN